MLLFAILMMAIAWGALGKILPGLGAFQLAISS